MATFGHLNELRPGSDRLSVYLERFELYCATNSVAAEKKVPLFLTVISPAEKDYAAIVAKLKAHFEPKATNVLAHRYTFHQRNQGPNESITDYMAELRRLASLCDFGSFLDQALRDRLVFGIASVTVQKRLLTEKEPTLGGLMEIALGLEAAQKNAQKLNPAEASQLYRMGRRQQTTRNTPKGEKKPCYRCDK